MRQSRRPLMGWNEGYAYRVKRWNPQKNKFTGKRCRRESESSARDAARKMSIREPGVQFAIYHRGYRHDVFQDGECITCKPIVPAQGTGHRPKEAIPYWFTSRICITCKKLREEKICPVCGATTLA